MRKSVEELHLELDADGMRTRGEQWGECTVRHLELPPGNDVTPLMKGLPGDLCQCPHWGIMLAGAINVRYADGSTEVARAGDLFYWPPGHTGWTDEAATFVEISPTAQLKPVLEHMARMLAESAGRR